ncbi:MAG: LLM class flavin-dependent oxidoreductase [Candidatus Caldarchaeum sp.]|uniref:LLM class flavin-dependent oxidoreductase n=1 Tax=Caldiarchaeum subterraneum TaxID=311458 RepID=A0A7C5LD95_CALS0
MRPFFSVELVPRDPVWKLLIAARIVEKNGFDGVWVSDHFFNRNCFMVLSALALNTRKIFLGPAVVNPYVTHPTSIAQMTATLWELAPNRVRLAVGAGDALSLKQLGLDREKPVERVGEAVKHVKKALTTPGWLDTYRASDVKVFVGAQGRRMMRMAAEVADGVLVNWSSMDKLLEALKTFGSRGFWKAAYIITSVHDDEAKARKTAVPFAAYLMAGVHEQYLNEFGISVGFRKQVEEVLRSKKWEELYAISSGDWVNYFCVWGKPKKLEGFADELVEAGYDEVVFAGPLGPRYLKALRDISLICRQIRKKWANIG